MKRWAAVRRALKFVGAGAGAAGMALLAAHPIVGAILAGIGGMTAALAVDLPRDKWSTEEVEAFRAKRTRRPTRPNPLLGLLAWLKGGFG